MLSGFVNFLMGFGGRGCVCVWLSGWWWVFFCSYAVLLFLVYAMNLHLSETFNSSLKSVAF